MVGIKRNHSKRRTAERFDPPGSRHIKEAPFSAVEQEPVRLVGIAPWATVVAHTSQVVADRWLGRVFLQVVADKKVQPPILVEVKKRCRGAKARISGPRKVSFIVETSAGLQQTVA